MAESTNIEWADSTLNLMMGCDVLRRQRPFAISDVDDSFFSFELTENLMNRRTSMTCRYNFASRFLSVGQALKNLASHQWAVGIISIVTVQILSWSASVVESLHLFTTTTVTRNRIVWRLKATKIGSLFMMVAGVFSLSFYFKVLRRVILLVTVNVVSFLAIHQGAAKFLLQDETMLINVAVFHGERMSRHEKNYVSVSGYYSTLFSH